MKRSTTARVLSRLIGAVVLQCLFVCSVFPAGSESKYLSLTVDTSVTTAQRILLSTTVTLPTASWVYIESDGRYFPSGPTMANMFIAVDSVRSSNDSTIDWGGSTNPQQHSYNCIGAVELQAGTHSFDLVGELVQGPGFVVGSGSNLSIMTSPAANVTAITLPSDTGPFNFNTDGVGTDIPVPHSPFLSTSVTTAGEPIVALGSGRAYAWGGYGDPMWGIYLDSDYRGNDEAYWASNDIFTGAETQAPLYGHAFLNPVSSGTHTVSLDASEFPWTGNPVQYKIGASTKLVTMNGGMTVRGSAPISSTQYGYTEYRTFGRGPLSIWPPPPGCGGAGEPPCVGTDVLLTEATVNIPSGHNGVVMFVAKNPAQGDPGDGGGTTRLWIEIDGVVVGSTGVQELKYPDGASQRAMSASYLAAGPNALSVGSHTVRVYLRADYRDGLNPASSFRWVSGTFYLPLLWFD